MPTPMSHPLMQSPPGRCPTRRLPVMLLAVVLALGQLLLAAHQVEHLAAGESGRDCPLCLSGNGLDHAVVAAVSPALAAPAFHPVPHAVAVPGPTAPVRAYPARGPPAPPSAA